MKHLIPIVLIAEILLCAFCAFARPTRANCTYRGISLGEEDPRLFSYADTAGLNIDLLYTLAKEIYNTPGTEMSDKNTFQDPRQLSSDEYEVLSLASMLTQTDVDFNFHYGSYGSICAPRADIERLISALEELKQHNYIDKTDIIDYLNIQKQYFLHMRIHTIDECQTMDSLDCEQCKIRNKYRFGTKSDSVCCKGSCMIFNSDLVGRERLWQLEWAYNYLSHTGMEYKTSMFDNDIRRIKEMINSINLSNKSIKNDHD